VIKKQFTVQANSAQSESIDKLIRHHCQFYKLVLKNIFYNVDSEKKFAKSIDVQFGFFDPSSSFVLIEHIEVDGTHSQFRFYMNSDSKELTEFSPSFEEYVDSCGSVFNFLINQLRTDTLFNVLNSDENNFMHKASYQHMGKPKDMKLFYGVDDIVFRKLQIERPIVQNRI
jgi:hypothetical protein